MLFRSDAAASRSPQASSRSCKRKPQAAGRWPQAEANLHRALAQGAGADAWEEFGNGFVAVGDMDLARRSYANALRVARGEAAIELPGRDLRQRIGDSAATEDRDEHGIPRLRG